MASWFPVVTLLLFAIARSRESCSTFTTEIDCDSQGACGWTNSICHCTSPTELDILFAIDGSGSMGLDNWIVQKNFIKNLTVHDINIDVSKIGFATFSHSVDFSRSIQSWQTIAELENYVSGLLWPAGWTFTWEAINQSVLEFTGERKGSSYIPDPNRKQVLILITDGNPCGPSSEGGCPCSLCPNSGIFEYTQSLPLIQDNDIRTVIVAIGSNIDPRFLDCLTQNDTDFITVSEFSATGFDAIAPYLSDVLCDGLTEAPIPSPTLSPTAPTFWPTLSPTDQPTFSCGTSTSENACVVDSQGACGWTNSACHCTSSTELDILFAIDGSGSIGLDNWIVQKNFIKNLTVHEINIDVSKIGFATFSRSVNFSRSIQSWQTIAELENYVSGLRWPEGWTYTWEAINQSVLEFTGERKGSSYIPDSNRKQVLILITDGNPCNSQDCPCSLCPNSGIFEYTQSLPLIQDNDIRTVIVAIGSNIDPRYLDCLTQNDTDFITVSEFSATGFDAITPYLSDVLCYDGPTEAPTPLPTDIPTMGPSRGPSPAPTHTPSPTVPPSPLPTDAPVTRNPTVPEQTDIPTMAPSRGPSPSPTPAPTPPSPTPAPTNVPTIAPTELGQTRNPTRIPTIAPTSGPTSAPTMIPTSTEAPTPLPHDQTSNPATVGPTRFPTHAPTIAPTVLDQTYNPTRFTTIAPTPSTTVAPSLPPTFSPTNAPVTRTPTVQGQTYSPTFPQTDTPTYRPTISPSAVPTNTPTVPPTAEEWEGCFEIGLFTIGTNEGSVFVEVERVSKQMKITLRGGFNWFGIGFGDAMNNTFAVIVQKTGGVIKVTQRRLGYHEEGKQIAPPLNVISTYDFTQLGRVVVLGRQWKVDAYDFTDFFEGNVCNLPIVWAQGSGASLAYHERKGTLNAFSCSCTEEPTNAPTVSPLAEPTQRPSQAPSLDVVQEGKVNHIEPVVSILFVCVFTVYFFV